MQGFRKIAAVLLIAGLAPVSAHAAGPYARVAVGTSFGSVEQPTLSPAHPVATSSAGDKSESDTGVALSLGYRFDGGWYAEAGHVDLGTYERLATAFGEDVSNVYASSAQRTEEAKAIEIKIGRAFSITREFAVYIEGGAQQYEREVTTTTQAAQTPKPSGSSTVTSSTTSSTEKKTGGVYGVGFEMIPAERLRMRFGVSQYTGIDRLSVSVGLQLQL